MLSKTKHNLALNLDLIGFSASTLCAIHCALMPFVFLILPLIGLGFVKNSLFEFSFILISLVIGLYTFRHGYLRHHKKLYPVFMFITGLSLIIISHFFSSDHYHHHESETINEYVKSDYLWILAPIGALLIAVSHFINRKLSNSFNKMKCSC